MRSCRPLLFCGVCCALLLSAAPSDGRDLLDRLLHPFTQSQSKSGGGTSSQHETVWSGLVMAENVAKPLPVPPELARFEQTLKDLFGYNQFQVIGESRKELKTGQEDWLATSKHFSLKVDTRGPSQTRNSPSAARSLSKGHKSATGSCCSCSWCNKESRPSGLWRLQLGRHSV